MAEEQFDKQYGIDRRTKVRGPGSNSPDAIDWDALIIAGLGQANRTNQPEQTILGLANRQQTNTKQPPTQ